MIASRWGKTDIVVELVKAGADVHILNKVCPNILGGLSGIAIKVLGCPSVSYASIHTYVSSSV